MANRHTILPVVLAVLGVACLVYGWGYHAQPVYPKAVPPKEPSGFGQAGPVPMMPPPPDEELQRPDDGPLPPPIPPPPPPPPPPIPGEDEEGGFPQPYFPPPMPSEPAEAAPLEPVLEPESRLVAEVTVGGIRRLTSGRLERTYSGFDRPQMCPT